MANDPHLQAAEQFQPGQELRHYKGGRYRFVGFATHTEDETALAVYTSVDGRLWARPAAMFLEYVDTGAAPPTPRFAPVASG